MADLAAAPTSSVPLGSGQQQWLRTCSLVISGASVPALELSALRITFTIEQNVVQGPNILHARVYNLSEASIKTIMESKLFTKVTLSCGYQGTRTGVIYDGTINQMINGRENPTDTFLDIFAQDGGKAYYHAAVSKTFPPNSTPKDHWNEITAQMQKYDVVAGFIGKSLDLSKPKYPRSVTLYGMARDFARTLAQSKNANWSIQRGKLILHANQDTQSNNAIKLDATTGMIGMPVEDLEHGITVRALINPDFNIGTLISIDQKSITRAVWSQLYGQQATAGKGAPPFLGTMDGTYVVYRIAWQGDTRGNPWYADLFCHGALTKGAAAPQPQVVQGF